MKHLLVTLPNLSYTIMTKVEYDTYLFKVRKFFDAGRTLTTHDHHFKEYSDIYKVLDIQHMSKDDVKTFKKYNKSVVGDIALITMFLDV